VGAFCFFQENPAVQLDGHAHSNSFFIAGALEWSSRDDNAKMRKRLGKRLGFEETKIKYSCRNIQN
jgi:hypothetical protein